MKKKTIQYLFAALFSLVTFSAPAQVSLPNGTPEVPIVDLRVKVLGGQVTIDRQWWEGQWRLNLRWAPAEWAGYPSGEGGCLAYPEIKIQGRTYTGDGQAWMLENRYNVRAIDHFTGNDCLANRTRKLKWQDRISGQWMEYERVDLSTLQFRLSRYGDKNNNTVDLAYDEAGQLSEVRDHFNNPVLHYTYSNGRLSEIRDVPNTDDPSPARAVKYGWGTSTVNGQATPVITQVTDVLGHVTHYNIVAGQLQTLTDPEGRIRKYAYTADRVTSYTDGEGKITKYVYDYDKLKREFYVRITSPNGTQTENWYDSEGQLIRRDIAGQTTYKRTAVDTVARSETRADAAGRQTTITRDEYGNLIKTLYPDGSSTSAKYSAVHGQMIEETDELGIKTRYDYDGKGNLLKKTEAVGLPEQRITEYEVNAYGQVLWETRKGGSITLPDGQTYTQADATRSFEYDTHGNRIAMIDALGSTTHLTVDRQGLALQRTDATGKTWNQVYDAAGHFLAAENPLNEETRYAYDKSGNRIQTINPLNQIWQNAFDKNNREVSEKNPLNETRTRQYDEQGRLISETGTAGNTLYSLVYDTQGRPIELIDTAGNRTKAIWDDAVEPAGPLKFETPGLTRTYTYDLRGRIWETYDMANTLVNGATQTVTTVARNTWDDKGQLIEITDKNSQKTRITYDGLGRMTQITDPLGGVTRYIWDSANNLIAVTDAQGSTTRYICDAENRRTHEIRPLGQTTRYKYDALGRLTQVTDPKGNHIAYQYDDASRRTGETHISAGASSPSRTIAYTWNAAGQLTGYTDSNSGHADHLANAATYTLDAIGRRTQETLIYGNQTYIQGTTWGIDGHKASQTWPDEQTLTYVWHAGQLQSITYPENATTTIAERWWSLPATTLYPGGTTQTQTWDGFGRLIGQQVKNPGQATLFQRTTTYDPENNPTRIDTDAGRHEYIYDALYRLTSATHPSGLPTEGFTLDKVGNRLTDQIKPNPAQANGQWRYDANHQLLQSATEDTAFFGSNSQPIDYTWDENGSLIQKTTPSGTEGQFPTDNQRYQYDAQNRLIETQDNNGNPIASYQYDPYGRRIRKTIYREWNGGWQALAEPRINTYLYSDEGLTVEYRQISSNVPQLVAAHGWEPEGQWGTAPLWTKTLRSDTKQVERFHHHNDHLGTPQKSTDASGAVVWSQKATAFGEMIVDPASVIENPFRFPGQYSDPETRTHYNYFRDYDPGVGRYRQSDPIGLEGSVNLHAYVEGNPISLIDPYGLFHCINGAKCDFTPEMEQALQCFDTCTGMDNAITGGRGNRSKPNSSHARGEAVDFGRSANPGLCPDEAKRCFLTCFPNGYGQEEKNKGPGTHYHFQLNTVPGGKPGYSPIVKPYQP
ncbi:RHS repeat-associated core domain-containing protein [Azonexus sp.]|jgi:RHS repeat-associated protein|uniref:RHS repeat-associated core domain-containing protein n=1 Tax=Azonexus sp. TaxID=1872668 RepID=UPI002829ACA9|nr:RHS repeat-associated core domain-containing protein [Azonexus sp.]MDR1996154.1 RHS domain-containing protein [Azonexus sp.]